MSHEATIDVLVNGPDGIIACSPTTAILASERGGSKQVRWSNGAVCYVVSASRPDTARGKSVDVVVFDEYAWMDDHEALEAVMTPLLRTREGSGLVGMRIIITTPNRSNPKVNKYLKDLSQSDECEYRRVELDRNRAVSKRDRDKMKASPLLSEESYREEIKGEIILDAKALLWTEKMIADANREIELPLYYDRMVMVLDPADKSDTMSNYSGLAVAAISGMDIFVLHTERGHWTPLETDKKMLELAKHFPLDEVFIEVNGIGEYGIAAMSLDVTPIVVKPLENKRVRASSILGAYENGYVHHIGDHAVLESEQTGFTGVKKTNVGDAMDTVDATVHAIRELYRGAGMLIEPIALDPRYATTNYTNNY